VTVKYLSSGTAQSASYTVAMPTGTEQFTGDVPLRMTTGEVGKSSSDFKHGDFVYESVQAETEGSVTCEITVDGVVISSNTSDGIGAIAQCSGSAP
jgi:hypothetical protein